MKIDSYIRHLELQRKGLKSKYRKMQSTGDTRIELGLDPLFEEKTETRNKVKETNDKLMFLTNLKKELINNEVQNKKNKQR